jgi:hypothetical protein
MLIGLDTYDSSVDMTELGKFGITLTSLEQFAKSFVAGAKQ